MSWQPIGSAPKDGTKVDLWAEDRIARTGESVNGRRIVKAWWGFPYAPVGWGQPPNKEGWVYQDEYTSPREELVEADFSGGATVVTHWMPLPEPPKEGER